MAIVFNQDSVWNLKPISLEEVREEVDGLLVPGEQMMMAFHSVRDQLVFTNKRIISIDVIGITGKKKTFSSLPYSKIQYFSVKTPGFAEIFPDNELLLVFPDGFSAKFEFKGNVDIGMICQIISEYIL